MSTPFGRPVQAESIPAELKAIPHWLLWRLKDRAGKSTKTPYQADGHLAKVNDPATWTTFETALAAYRAGGFSGLGIALSDDDDLAGVDLDKCLNPDTGELHFSKTLAEHEQAVSIYRPLWEAFDQKNNQ